ncbi:HEPN domain-containing protein [Actinomadura sp. ATCC 31491]|uniref:HEPN domain-containing protein n=1 Tax=Actinomadura luzonensis TaxID=2805427 RepID=A0ABT0FM86_9ACTN|nr:HEPN domain-containing protein [Actinomadura luzonensis]MCK2213454.1 HEPN domain-containing protein [Actinomadura luzonensis]
MHESARAFRLLAHAEFEAFIEDRAQQIVSRAVSEWLAHGNIRPSLLALVAYESSLGWKETTILSASERQKKAPNLTERVEAARKNYLNYVIMQNNGIKEKNLLRILLPLGVREEDIDEQWLSALEAWATARGELAHKSGKPQRLLDPQVEYVTVQELRDGFRVIDELLEQL